MRVLLVFSPPLAKGRLGEMLEGMLPPLGILYLAAYLRKNLPGIEVAAVDGLVKGWDETLNEIRSFKPDVLGVSFLTTAALGAYELVSEAKKENPNMVAILGGPHATALPEDGLTRSPADVVVIGEGEQTLLELVTILQANGKLSREELEKVDGIVYKDESGSIRRTKIRSYIVNLDDIAFPARDLLPRNNYRGYYLCKQTPETTIIFSRGCPADCTFCSNMVWKLCKPIVRVRSPRNVVDEMEELYHQGIREVQDCGDEFNNNIRNSLGICEELKARNLGMTWNTCVRARPLPEELVRAMAESGCWMVSLGIESGNNETLTGIKKLVTLEHIENACTLLKKYGIKVQGLFMLYNVWEQSGELRYETSATTRNTLKFAERLVNRGLLQYIGWSITSPYPGSELYDIAMRHGLIKENLIGNWDAWNRDEAFVMKLPGVSEIEQARLKRSGSVLRAKCMIRSGNFGLKDIGVFTRKGLKILQMEAKALVQSRMGIPFAKEGNEP